MQRRSDYIFISQGLYKRTRNVDSLNAVSRDHSLILCLFLNSTEFVKSPGIWKLKNSFIFDRNFVKEMIGFMHGTKQRLVTEDVFDKQIQWKI